MRHDELTDADLEAVIGGMGRKGKKEEKKEEGGCCGAAAPAPSCCG